MEQRCRRGPPDALVTGFEVFLALMIPGPNKINFSRSKKNPTFEHSPKVVQMKLLLKAKSLSLANGVVIREPSPNAGRPAVKEVASKGKEKAEEPSQKAKHSSNSLPSSSKTN
ncbi:Uncharacterized protein Adt_21199 [Abeliophyllum distichum]|uniref:Uncharacterized protein n=1 Tax=Abeliophyllum distichum TaxID=126358 RepID=A0ABD1SZ04_9LAMI